MFNIIILLGIYFFILLGFVAKKIFSEIHERTLVLLSVYFLQPILAFWGIFSKPFEAIDFAAPAWYFAISVLAGILSFFLFSRLLNDPKDVSIVTATGIIGNTGNLGIPLLIGLFGKSVAFYAVLINTANVFVLYIGGVFLYSLGKSNTRESLKNILKIPVLWFALTAISLNFLGVKLHPAILQTIEMGAYTGMTLQLIIFGVFLGGLTSLKTDIKIVAYGLLNKMLFVPLLAFVILYFAPLSTFLKTIVFIQICVPVAVNNVNFASLYDCKPYTVTVIILFSSLLFLAMFSFYANIFQTI